MYGPLYFKNSAGMPPGVLETLLDNFARADKMSLAEISNLLIVLTLFGCSNFIWLFVTSKV